MKLKRFITALLTAVSLAVSTAQAEETVPLEPAGQPAGEQEMESSLLQDCQDSAEETAKETDPSEKESPSAEEEDGKEDGKETERETKEDEETDQEADGTQDSEPDPDETGTEPDSKTDGKEAAEPEDDDSDSQDAPSKEESQEKEGTRGEDPEGDDKEIIDSQRLISRGQIAQFESLDEPGQMDFIHMFFFGERPCYCVEPGVEVVLHDGEGAIYQGHVWDEADEEVRRRCKRIAYYGYGYPRTGKTKEAYAATQLLIWEAIAPDKYERIIETLHMCSTPNFDYRACSVDRRALDTVITRLRNFVDNFDTAPSFASNAHRTLVYEIAWGETLVLEDKNHVLSWFNSESEEDHPGIELSIEGNQLKASISDLYYAGYDTQNGIPLTFRRKEEDWNNVMAGVLLYEYENQQKVITATDADPTPYYQLSFRLKSANIRIEKQDEYGESGEACAGTEFVIGWEDDPEIEHPLKDRDGNTLVLCTDETGSAELNHLLPSESTWWIKEKSVPQGFKRLEGSWRITTGPKYKTTSYTFVNPLRDVNLELYKQDEETPDVKLNDARFVIYEVGENLDYDRRPVSCGIRDEDAEEPPVLSWNTLQELTEITKGAVFEYSGYRYEITEIAESTVILTVTKCAAEKPDEPNSTESGEGEEEQKRWRVEVVKNSGLSFADVESARYETKTAGMHVKQDGTLYRIEQVDEDAVTLKDEEGNTIVIHRHPTADEPFSFEEYEALPSEMIEQDEIRIKGELYRYLAIETRAPYGRILHLKRLRDHAVMEVREIGSDAVYESENLQFLKTGEEAELTLSGGAASFRMRSENPHVTLKETEGKWMISANANCTAILEALDKEGDLDSVKRIIFSSTESPHETGGLPVFSGITGHQYVRITDPRNHNMPVAGMPLVLFADKELQEKKGSFTSDAYGAVDISELGAGTYYYRDPFTGDIRSIAAEDASYVKGQLKVQGLKWGRTYLALEETLPEGYDYGDNEVSHTFRMNTREGTDTVQAEVNNFLRRIDVKVFKLDQDDQKTPLNNAWFSVRDITGGAERSSTVPVSLSDIPAEAAAGDIIPVWRENPAGAVRNYHISAIQPDVISVVREDDGQAFSVPVKGSSADVPMLYSDILKALGKPRENTVFSVREKQPYETIRLYRIISIERAPAADIYGNMTAEHTIRQVQLTDMNDSSSRVHIISASEEMESRDGIFLGEFVSGGIMKRIMHEEPVCPLTFEQALAAGLSAPGASGMIPVVRTADMPSYETSRSALNSGKSILNYGGADWQLADGGEVITLTLGGKQAVLSVGTKPGALSYEAMEPCRVASVESEEGNLSAVTICDSTGSTWYLRKGAGQVTHRVGTPGVHVKVKALANGSVADGYTDRQGRIIFADLAEGDYEVQCGEETGRMNVQKGVVQIPDMKYGHSIEICETKSPLGYLIGEACAVIVPQTGYTLDTVTNARTNAKTVTRREEVRRIVMNRRTGIR